MIPLSLYIHIPFCRERCSYCAFNTYADMADAIPSYVGALLREVSLVGSYPSMQGQAIHTIYLGGGTPSLLSGKQVGQILTTCRHYFGVMDDTEISLEANPGTIDADKLHAYREAGVNRLSLGVQSAHARDLELFGRLHDFDEAGEAFRQGRAAGFEHINVDLIYGIPYQTFAEWQTTLDCVLDWKPDHMSLYSLSLEPGTPLRRQVQALSADITGNTGLISHSWGLERGRTDQSMVCVTGMPGSYLTTSRGSQMVLKTKGRNWP